MNTELYRILGYSLPGLALIWYLILSEKKREPELSLSAPYTLRDILGADLWSNIRANKWPELRTELRSMLRYELRTSLRSNGRAFFVAFPGLILVGIALSMISSIVMTLPPSPIVERPAGAAAWLVIILSCISTGYLEESYFRYYLLRRFRKNGVVIGGIILSVLLFSFCHLYEGFWGVLNAALAGILLSLVFIREDAFHGIALAHGAYNIMVYILGS
jgi:membrane protease YdiL (CAAX protease family)